MKEHGMDVQATLATIFPSGTVSMAGNSGFEVNDLLAGTTPQNCEVLLTGEEQLSLSPMDRRTYYLARAEDRLFFFRICTAMKGSGYAEFAAGLGYAELGPLAEALTERAQRIIDDCCRAPA